MNEIKLSLLHQKLLEDGDNFIRTASDYPDWYKEEVLAEPLPLNLPTRPPSTNPEIRRLETTIHFFEQKLSEVQSRADYLMMENERLREKIKQLNEFDRADILELEE